MSTSDNIDNNHSSEQFINAAILESLINAETFTMLAMFGVQMVGPYLYNRQFRNKINSKLYDNNFTYNENEDNEF